MPYTDQRKNEEWHRNRYLLVVKPRRINFLNGKSCGNCGSTDKLELDHINPKTKISHNVWTWSEENRNNELKKCQVLCRRCHQIKTAKERGFPPPSPKINLAAAKHRWFVKHRIEIYAQKKRARDRKKVDKLKIQKQVLYNKRSCSLI